MADDRGRRLRMSYDEWFEWYGEGQRGEWVDGEVIVIPSYDVVHQSVLGFLAALFGCYADRLDLGEVILGPFEMWLRDGRSARTPDLVFIAREHLVRLDEQRLNGPADLVVEVVSAESATRDRVEKFAEYEAAGVREYWLVDTRPGNEGTEFFRLAATGTYEPVTPDADGRLHSTALPGFWLKPEWLWQEPLPNPLTLLAEIAPHAVRDALDPGERDV